MNQSPLGIESLLFMFSFFLSFKNVIWFATFRSRDYGVPQTRTRIYIVLLSTGTVDDSAVEDAFTMHFSMCQFGVWIFKTVELEQGAAT